VAALALAFACGGPASQDTGAPDAPRAFSAALTVGPHDGPREIVVPISERPDLNYTATVTAAGDTDPALFLGVWGRTTRSVVLGFAASPDTTLWVLDVTPTSPDAPRLL